MNFLKKLLTPLCVVSSLAFGANSAHASCGTASYYGPGLYGNLTASGEVLRPGTMTAAHPYLPFGSYVRVTNQSNGKSVIVRVSDRGPYVASRDLDLSYIAFSKIAPPGQGLVQVCYHRV